MVKLNPEVAKRVATAESTGGLMDECMVPAILVGVVVHPKKGNQQADQLEWKYVIAEDATQYGGRKISDWVSQAEGSDFKMQAHFLAQGVGTDVDTDEILNGRVILHIVKEQKYNALPGVMVNKIQAVLPDPAREISGEAPASKKKLY